LITPTSQQSVILTLFKDI